MQIHMGKAVQNNKDTDMFKGLILPVYDSSSSLQAGSNLGSKLNLILILHVRSSTMSSFIVDPCFIVWTLVYHVLYVVYITYILIIALISMQFKYFCEVAEITSVGQENMSLVWRSKSFTGSLKDSKTTAHI